MFWLIRTVAEYLRDIFVTNPNSSGGQLLLFYFQYVIWFAFTVFVLSLVLRILKKISFGTIDPKIKIDKKEKAISEMLWGWWFQFGVLVGFGWVIMKIWKSTAGAKYEKEKKYQEWKKKKTTTSDYKERFEKETGKKAPKNKEDLKEKTDDDEEDEDFDDEEEDEEEERSKKKETKKKKASPPPPPPVAPVPAPAPARPKTARQLRNQERLDRQRSRRQAKIDRQRQRRR